MTFNVVLLFLFFVLVVFLLFFFHEGRGGGPGSRQAWNLLLCVFCVWKEVVFIEINMEAAFYLIWGKRSVTKPCDT